MSLPDKPRAVVTGAAGGLGRAIALELAGRSARVVVSDIDEAGAEETRRLVDAAGGEAHVVLCDVARSEEVERLLEDSLRAMGGVDLMVNNAGVAVSGKMGDVPLRDWEWVVSINLWGVIYGCHVFAPYFREQKSGHFLNVASAAGLLSSPGMGPYNVTKAGVVALSETIAPELKVDGVGVTVLCPMFFRTAIFDSARNHLDDTQAMGTIERLMDRSRIQAPEVAHIAIEACARDRVYAVPHASGRFMWRVKRALPEVFHGPLAAAMTRRASR